MSDELFTQIYQYDSQIREWDGKLNYVKQFLGSGELWPDQRRFALYVFTNVLKPIRSLAKLLKTNTSFPHDANINRYTLLAQVNLVEKTLSDIVSRLEAHQLLYPTGLNESHGEQMYINSELDTLWRSYKNLTHIFDHLIVSVPSEVLYVS